MTDQSGNRAKRKRTHILLPVAGFAACLLLLTAFDLFAQSASPAEGGSSTTGQPSAQSGSASPAGPVVFISSDPIRAVVIIDGKTIPARTPLLLRNLKAGKHKVQIGRAGYAPYFGTFVVADTKPTTLNATLAPQFVVPRFDSSSTTVVRGKQVAATGERYRLPSGDYRVGSRNGQVTVEPVSPHQQLTGIVDLATGVLLVASAVLVGEAILNATTSGSTNGSTSTGGSGGGNVGNYIPVWIGTGISAISDVSLHIQRSRYLKAYAPAAVPSASPSTSAEQSYTRAQELLASGDLAGSAELYLRIVQYDTDSPYYPRALYQLAKIQIIQGDNLLASTELRLILDKYPSADLYDKSCKSLADLSYRDQDYKSALGYLDKMVFLDPLFTRSQIQSYRSEIEKKIAGGAGT